jgi:hypothetical protein
MAETPAYFLLLNRRRKVFANIRASLCHPLLMIDR